MTAEAEKPSPEAAPTGEKEPEAKKVLKAGPGKPVQAILAFIVALVQAILLLIYPFVLGQFDAVGALFFLFGLMMIVFVYYVFKIEYWSWSSVLIVLILILLLAVPALITSQSLSAVVIVGYGTLLAVVLFIVRKTYGVGVWKEQQIREEKEKKIREAKRTANPDKLHCPRCSSNDLYITEDGSAFCRNCNVGYVNIHDISMAPKSSS